MDCILVAHNLSERASWATERAVRLAAETGAPVVVLHVTDPNAPPAVAAALRDEAHKLISERLPVSPDIRSTEVRVVAGRPIEQIVAAAASLPAGLIVIGRHERHPVLDLFRGSTGERVLRMSNVPALTVSRRPAADYRRVLVALDFSMPSRLALEYAARTFPAATFHVLHAWETPFSGIMTDTADKVAMGFRRMVEQQLTEFLAGLPHGLPKLHPSTREAPPGRAIRECVASQNADLLVLGTHGRTGVVRAFIGSVTEELLKDPPCDVLAVGGW